MPVREVIAISVMMILCSVIAIQWEWIAVEKMDNRSLNTELYDLQVQSVQENQRYQDAQEQAEKELKDMQKQVEQVLTTNVPKKCTEAMKWAIDQAKTFKD